MVKSLVMVVLVKNGRLALEPSTLAVGVGLTKAMRLIEEMVETEEL